VEFLNWIRSRTQIIVVSDTFDQFASPLMEKLGWPTLFCHTLSIAPDGFISDYILRQKDAKREAVISLKTLNYNTIAMGDSYNDITMLKEADNGILFNPPDNVKNEFPEFPVTFSYEELKSVIENILSNNRSK
jgi:phosphoserine/homoserine phosphotransferase